MSFPLFRVWVVLTGCAMAGAQTPPPAPPPGTIAGMVLDAGNNSPIRRAVVTLSTVEARPQDAVAWTDANGRFAFGYLPPGRYELRVSKNGYQNTIYGADSPRRPPGTISLAAGAIRSDLVFRLQLITTITGTVVDDHGDPLQGVSILAMRQGWQRRKRTLIPGPSTNSDASGHYHLTGLAPAAYAIVASQDFRRALSLDSEAVAGQTQRVYCFGRQYYPGTGRADSATLIPVEPGHEYANIDFQFTARPCLAVRGKVIPPSGIALEQVTVNASSTDTGMRGANFGAGARRPDFAFQFDRLEPGQYRLVAQANSSGKLYRGSQTVDVSGDISDLSIPLQPSIDLAGSITVEGPDAAKYLPTSVSLVSGDGVPLNGRPPSALVNRDGTFKIADVLPGVWDINTGRVPPDGYIKSMRLGDQDVLTEDMVIEPTTQADLKIVMSTRSAHVQGEVSLDGQPARAFVLLAPEPRFRHVLSFYRVVGADPAGHFEIKNAAPGTYQLYAFDEYDPQSIQDPEFLKPFDQHAVTLTLREGENPPQKLTVLSTARMASGGAQ